MPKLGVNIDHVATLRQARKTVPYPDPIMAAYICEGAGCDSIVCHLREDRRHIIDKDVLRLKKEVKTRLNLEMSIAPEIVDIACSVKPDYATLVPEKREELTTEGGLDVIKNFNKIKKAVSRLHKNGIAVSLFVDPTKEAIKASKDIGVDIVELHTGEYANAKNKLESKKELDIIKRAVDEGLSSGLTVNAGHGLNYENVIPVAIIPGIEELNIGHAIISYAVLYGLEEAVRKMKGFIS